MATGAAADAIAIYQDLSGTWQYEAPITHALVAFRGGFNLLNGAFGHSLYLSQLLQDALIVPVPPI